MGIELLYCETVFDANEFVETLESASLFSERVKCGHLNSSYYDNCIVAYEGNDFLGYCLFSFDDRLTILEYVSSRVTNAGVAKAMIVKILDEFVPSKRFEITKLTDSGKLLVDFYNRECAQRDIEIWYHPKDRHLFNRRC